MLCVKWPQCSIGRRSSKTRYRHCFTQDLIAPISTSWAISKPSAGAWESSMPSEDIADVPGAPRRAYITRDDITTATASVAGMLFYLGAATAAMTVVASGGSLALVAAIAAAAGTTGAGIGAAAIHHLGKKQAEDLELQLTGGGIVVWVRVHNREMEERAQEVLAKSGGDAIRMHEIEIEKRLDDLPLSKFNPDPLLGIEPPARH